MCPAGQARLLLPTRVALRTIICIYVLKNVAPTDGVHSVLNNCCTLLPPSNHFLLSRNDRAGGSYRALIEACLPATTSWAWISAKQKNHMLQTKDARSTAPLRMPATLQAFLHLKSACSHETPLENGEECSRKCCSQCACSLLSGGLCRHLRRLLSTPLRKGKRLETNQVPIRRRS